MKNLFCLILSFRCSCFDVIRFVTLLNQLQNRVLFENLSPQIFSCFQQGQDKSIAKENKAKMYLWKMKIFEERKILGEFRNLKINEEALILGSNF